MKFLKEQYRLSFSFFRGPLWSYFKNATIAFFAIYLISILASLLFPSIQKSLITYIQSVIEQAGIVDNNGSISAVSIMFNNLHAAALSILYGIIPFLYLPALPIGLNASIIGAVTSSYIVSSQSLLLFAAGLIPHGIFEIPALLIAFACGLYLCHEVTQRLSKSTSNKERTPLVETILSIMRVYLTIVVPLLIIASFIEAYVTPILMSFFM